MADTSLFFDIFGRDKGVGKMFDDVGAKGKGLGGALKGVGMAMGAGLLALGAAVGVAGFDKLKEASASTEQLKAGLKSTHDVSNTTLTGMNDLADSIQGYSGVSNDAIKNTEGLLLTFTNIRNVGPNKIFDQATVAATDMAAKMGGDASSNAILLGKALNDPTKGLTALTRVGVSFTAGQKASIKAMQSSGNIMGAQKIILKELNTEFGGAAKAAGDSLPGQLAKAKNAFSDMAGSMMSALLPALIGIAKGMATVAKWAQANQPLVLVLATAFGILAVAFIAASVGPTIMAAAMTVLASPFLLIGIAIAALIAGLVFAYNRIGWFKDGVNAVFGFIKALVTNLVSFIVTYMVPIWTAEFHIIATICVWLYSNVIAPYFNLIISIIRNVVNFVIGTLVPGFVNSARWIASAILGAISGFESFRSGVINAVSGAISFVESIPGRITGALSGIDLSGIGSAIMGSLLGGLQAAWTAVQNFVGGIAGWIKDHKGPISVDRVLLTPAGGAIMDGLNDALRSRLPDLTATLGVITDTVGGTRFPTTRVAAQLAASRGGPGGGQQAPVYVQNPWGAEYMQAKVDDRVNTGIGKANSDLGRRPAR